MSGELHVACLQTRPRAEFDSALDEASALVRDAAASGVELAFLPEYCGGLRTDGARLSPPAAPEGEHPVLNALAALAADTGVWLSVGSLAVRAGPGRIRNRGFLIDPTGEVRARYDKLHLFDVELSENEVYRESDGVAAGDEAILIDTPLARIGCSICYDLRFPRLYRALAQAGAEILAVPAAFTRRTGEAHWHVLNRARAIENGAFVIAPCAVGPVPGGGASYGHSLIVDPWGAVLADGGDRPGIVEATIRLDAVSDARRRIPSLAHDRDFAVRVVTAESPRRRARDRASVPRVPDARV